MGIMGFGGNVIIIYHILGTFKISETQAMPQANQLTAYI